MDQVAKFIDGIVAQRAETPANRAVLVGISGIDAGGKGFITAKIARRLREAGWRVATINADDWLNLPEVCLSRRTPGEHFYEHAMRFDEMFDQLIVPLKENRAVSFIADCADARGKRRKHRYEFRKIDIILLEGIFLFRPAYRNCFDLTVWVDCSFATALKRAITRCQEGLPPAETIRAFTTIYFPAQRIHFARDNPQGAADFIIQNEKASRIHAQS
ncbi:MAG: uridine kinase [Verrucomicrobia bacterium]|nr:MAG: uridine kinase [Verrucomicrobiota bacterium]